MGPAPRGSATLMAAGLVEPARSFKEKVIAVGDAVLLRKPLGEKGGVSQSPRRRRHFQMARKLLKIIQYLRVRGGRWRALGKQ